MEVDSLLLKTVEDAEFYKYDDWPAYREGIHKLQQTKGLDLIGWFGESVLLGEIKNFRGHRIENKKKLQHGTLFEETALKLRDTLAGLVAISRSGTDHAEVAKRMNKDLLLGNRQRRVVVFLYVDEDDSNPRDEYRSNRRKQRLNVYMNALKRATSWFPAKKLVFDRGSLPDSVGIVEVSAVTAQESTT